jgi:hypothetical protein
MDNEPGEHDFFLKFMDIAIPHLLTAIWRDIRMGLLLNHQA